MATRHYCDRCGVEATETQLRSLYLNARLFRPGAAVGVFATPFDTEPRLTFEKEHQLCEACLLAFDGWLAPMAVAQRT